MKKKAQNQTQPSIDRLISKTKVAKLLDVSTRTIDRWVKAELLHKVYIGSTVRFRLSEVRELAGI